MPTLGEETDKERIRSLVQFMLSCYGPNMSHLCNVSFTASLPEQQGLFDYASNTLLTLTLLQWVVTFLQIRVVVSISIAICISSNSMLSTEAFSRMNRDKGFHGLRTSTAEVPSLIFFVVTLGTFRRQAAEGLRVYVRGQKMIDSLGCREESKHLLP